MNNLVLEAYPYTEYTREPESDYWDKGTTHTDWTIADIYLSDNEQEYSIPNSQNFVPGDTVYVLYAIYSVGDSFGNNDNGRLCFLSVNKDKDIAKANKSTCLECESYILLDDGKEINTYKPWEGYFEYLNDLVLDVFIISNKKVPDL